MEQVNHPKHYGGADDPYEVIKVLEAWGTGFHLGNVIKYVARSGKKGDNPTVQDLEKARWYLDRKITALRNQEKADQLSRRGPDCVI